MVSWTLFLLGGNVRLRSCFRRGVQLALWIDLCTLGYRDVLERRTAKAVFGAANFSQGSDGRFLSVMGLLTLIRPLNHLDRYL